jgi:hypothetical protein
VQPAIGSFYAFIKNILTLRFLAPLAMLEVVAILAGQEVPVPPANPCLNQAFEHWPAPLEAEAAQELNS